MKDIILKPGSFQEVISSPKAVTGAMPGTSLEKFVVNLLKSPTCCAKYVSLTKGTVTQATSISTEVTLSQPAGVITTVSLTTAADTTESAFTVTNSYVTASSVIIANIQGYSGTTGFPVILVDDVAAGSFKITVRNVHNAAALNGTLSISFVVM
jgi:hypothetical protein